jgi:diketogulonate reductase-like aldo/keto reductase
LQIKKGCTTGQLTLAWILQQGELVFAIPSTSKIKNLEENIGAPQIKLTKEEIEQIRKASQNADTHGERYTKEHIGKIYSKIQLLSTNNIYNFYSFFLILFYQIK